MAPSFIVFLPLSKKTKIIGLDAAMGMSPMDWKGNGVEMGIRLLLQINGKT